MRAHRVATVDRAYDETHDATCDVSAPGFDAVRGANAVERIHDPIIFQNALDGIDLKTHIVAAYYLSDRLEGVEFIDHYKLIESIAIEGSTGTWQKVAEDTEEVRTHLSGKLVGYYELPSDDNYRKSAVIQLAFPIEAWHDNVPMMLTWMT